MITPPYLNIGDKVALVAPARKVSPSEMEVALRTLSSWDLKVVTSRHLFGNFNQYSGTDEERSKDMQDMLDDQDIRAIICARGGYGTVRIIDKLDFNTFVKYPKWIVGYSDITVLHSHIHTLFGIETIHGTMPVNFADEGSDVAIESLRKALFGENLEYHLEPHVMNRTGAIARILTGGNLSILYSLNGTPSDINTEDKILFIEDIDEYLYHLDRMMMNMKRSGKLTGVKGIIVGSLGKMNDNAIPFGKKAEEILVEYCHTLGIPVSFNFPAGNLLKNHALILGRTLELNIGVDEVVLRFLTKTESLSNNNSIKKLLIPSLFVLGFFLFIYVVLYFVRHLLI